jgi:hypothetical protein
VAPWVMLLANPLFVSFLTCLVTVTLLLIEKVVFLYELCGYKKGTSTKATWISDVLLVTDTELLIVYTSRTELRAEDLF